MVSAKIKPTTIGEYIDAAPADVQERLWQLHNCIIKVAPGALEELKWNMPSYSYQKILVTFAVFKKHIGFYPMESAIKAFAKDLVKYKTASGSVQFPLDAKLPLTLIKRIVLFRVKESKAQTIKWRQ
jgi:uncharacterized protein YdhG (YjbR/CyaY superfamily)